MAIRFIFNADSAVYPSGSAARFTQVISGSNMFRVLAFSDTNTERALFTTTAPSGWSGSISASITSFPASATNNEFVWELSVFSASPGGLITGSNFATTGSVSGSVTGASQWRVSQLNIGDNGILPGYFMQFLLRRLPTNASDTASSDMYFSNLIIADGR